MPLLIAVAPSWGWIVAANLLLGINQGLAWSMTVVMKIDLVGPERRGFALGLNEAAGYGGVALAAALSGWLAAEFAARDVLVVAGAAIAVTALAAVGDLSSATPPRTSRSSSAGRPRRRRGGAGPARGPSPTPPTASRRCARARRRAWSTTSTTPSPGGWCRSSSPPSGASAGQIGLVAGLYPAVWGVGQIWTGRWSDRIGRKPLIVAGMLLQAAALRGARGLGRGRGPGGDRRGRASGSGRRSSIRR